jgi:predicted DNA-binding transcriptional regulator YafY
MKIDRLIGIITVLLREQKVTAPYLAEKFEVSRRTINRDIENICQAGIPIITEQGYNGGISIAQGYKIEKALFTNDDLKMLFTGLKGLDSVLISPKSDSLAKKFAVKSNAVVSDNILIDLSSHYKNSLSLKIDDIRNAIDNRQIIEFDYFYSKGSTKRRIEPYLVVFQWSAWYVYGYCKLREDFRMFKLNRLWNLTVTDEKYIYRDNFKEKIDFNSCFIPEFHLMADVNKNFKYRLVDEYGINCYTENDNGTLHFETYFTNYNELLIWVQSFGDGIKVIEPECLKKDLLEKAKKIVELYSET